MRKMNLQIFYLGITVLHLLFLHVTQAQHLLNAGQQRKSAVDSNLIDNGTVYRLTVKNKDTLNYATYNVFIPKGIDRIRGVLIHQHGCGMEGRGVSTAYDVQYQSFAKKWNLAIVGADLYYTAGCYAWREPDSGSGESLLAALTQIGEVSDQSALGEAPWLLWGHSGGGYWALAMIRDYPQRVLAAFCYSPAFDPSWNYPKEALEIPLMIRHAGATDANSPEVSCWATAVNSFKKLRRAGGLVSIAYTPYQNHNYSFVRYMAIPFYESALSQRLPRGRSASFREMRKIDRTRGWLGDTLSLNTYPYRTYKDEASSMSWLPDSATAAAWKEYVITGSVIDRTPPPPPFELRIARLHSVSVALRWKADADIESGIKHFNIYNNDQLIARFPEHGVYQYFDTNGDDAIPMSALPEMKIIATALKDSNFRLTISAVNHFNLESERITFPSIE
ncbi:alpha/beta hydrolase family protein [Sphingobacterium pedocola]|nr:alpha/beta hydrolase [Sphingobacterium pedocola]